MPLAWDEIRHRGIKFTNENSYAASEASEKQTFWNEFFEVFGIARKTVASFEAPVKKDGCRDAINLPARREFYPDPDYLVFGQVLRGWNARQLS